MACDPQLLQRLSEAKSAYHKLKTGTMARVVVDQNGERVEFTAAKGTDLYNYIQELESQVRACSGNGLPLPNNGPASFYF